MVVAACALGLRGEARAGVFDDPPAAARVVEVSRGPGEVVYTVNDVTIVLARTPGPDERAPDPTCRANGYDLRAPAALDGVVHEAVIRACASLRARAPVDVPQPPPSPWSPSPEGLVVLLRGVAAAWLLLLLAAVPRRVEPWAWGAVAVVVRWVVAPPHILMSVGYPYGALLTYAGTESPSLLYGAGWNAVLDLARPLLGAAPDQLHLVHALLSALVVPLLWATATHAGATPRVARLTALLATVLPVAVSLGTTETLFVLVATLHAAALLGAARADRLGAWLLALSAGLLAHVRPDQGGVVLVMLLALLLTRRWLPLVLAAALVGARLVEVASAPPGLIPVSELGGLSTIGNPLWGQGSSVAVLDPTLSPFWLVPAGLLGAWVSARTPRARGVALLGLGMVIAGTVPYVGLHRYTDTARFQLPVWVSWVLLAGASASWLRGRSAVTHALAAAVVVSGLALATTPLTRPLAHDVEHRLARTALCTLPPGTRVRYDRARDPFNTMSHYFAAVCHVTLTGWDDAAPLRLGDRVWQGVGDRWHGPHSAPHCTLRPDVVVQTEAWDGGLEDLGQSPMPVGLFTATGCP